MSDFPLLFFWQFDRDQPFGSVDRAMIVRYSLRLPGTVDDYVWLLPCCLVFFTRVVLIPWFNWAETPWKLFDHWKILWYNSIVSVRVNSSVWLLLAVLDVFVPWLMINLGMKDTLVPWTLLLSSLKLSLSLSVSALCLLCRLQFRTLSRTLFRTLSVPSPVSNPGSCSWIRTFSFRFRSREERCTTDDNYHANHDNHDINKIKHSTKYQSTQVSKYQSKSFGLTFLSKIFQRQGDRLAWVQFSS